VISAQQLGYFRLPLYPPRSVLYVAAIDVRTPWGIMPISDRTDETAEFAAGGITPNYCNNLGYGGITPPTKSRAPDFFLIRRKRK
jgi:hypothetical protein